MSDYISEIVPYDFSTKEIKKFGFSQLIMDLLGERHAAYMSFVACHDSIIMHHHEPLASKHQH
jgi:hypothetical protein